MAFQSLLGFLMRCDTPVTAILVLRQRVSIPAGFSDALRQRACVCVCRVLAVSIPAGFSDALRHHDLIMKAVRQYVSIPAGFSDALRRCEDMSTGCINIVSIPAGFSDALRPVVSIEFRGTIEGFNPCWVF